MTRDERIAMLTADIAICDVELNKWDRTKTRYKKELAEARGVIFKPVDDMPDEERVKPHDYQS